MTSTKTIITTVTVSNGKDDKGKAIEVPPGEPITLPTEEANRILACFGGEEFVVGTARALAVPPPSKSGPGAPGGGAPAVDYTEMTRKQLDEIAAGLGIDSKKLPNKAEVIAAIEAATKPQG